MGNKFGLDKILKDYEALKRTLPAEVGDEAAAHFKKNFPNQGFDNEKWKEVQRRTPGTNAYKYPKKKDLGRRTRGILKKTGRLQRSIRRGYTSFGRTVIATDVPYAQAINEGSKNMPQRKIIGRSKPLEDKLKRLIDKRIGGLFKK